MTSQLYDIVELFVVYNTGQESKRCIIKQTPVFDTCSHQLMSKTLLYHNNKWKSNIVKEKYKEFVGDMKNILFVEKWTYTTSYCTLVA